MLSVAAVVVSPVFPLSGFAHAMSDVASIKRQRDIAVMRDRKLFFMCDFLLCCFMFYMQSIYAELSVCSLGVGYDRGGD